MKILILSSHVDDAEICMGGTIAKLAKDNEVKVVFFSDCDIYHVRGEVSRSMKALGVDKWYLLSYPRRTMDDRRHEIRNLMFEDNVKGYDRVYCPHPNDHHQDHKLIAELARNVFGNDCDLIYYIWAKNNNDYRPTLFEELSEEQLNDKLAALNCYKSQKKARAKYFNDEAFSAMATFYGMMAGCRYAEPFEPYRIKI